MDNFYNSFGLGSQLLTNNTYFMGTLWANRKYNPPDVMKKKLNKGETIAQYEDGVMIVMWRDRWTVTYISKEHENTMAMYINPRLNYEVNKPLSILKYNIFMKGVDHTDQLMTYYLFERKSLRWYKKIFVHILEIQNVEQPPFI